MGCYDVKAGWCGQYFLGLNLCAFSGDHVRWANMPDPQYIFPWKMIGILSIVLGVFFFIAAFNLRQHVLIITFGLILKITETVLC